ncbi:hypothetical protein GLAREA_05040 [Glarea lozoyensis ATCC 20868]|uniref:DUF6594 domain-containing protein n=1 Tax=Glarea lozoyensis (strain ATCC 20868 / MF5171) TaxID=1116229 RepID=S3EBM1_GLAL2|nr:uncharacterized protein GLAREA_05040 [Glarea lozoyensis ATCC 20868]EPE35703.1 hypothetical protein GLAREA_05040 [Glarea lozoyensis ATCC 20868]
MTTSYTAPTVSVIQELSEDERGELKSPRGNSANERIRRQPRTSQEIAMPHTKATAGKEKERERSRKYHKTTATGTGGSRHASKPKPKNTTAKRASVDSSRERDAGYEGRSKHRRSYSNQSQESSSSSSSSESETDQPTHRVILASPRSRLTSPSTISNLTSLTSSTNKSSSSSGSNSTVTQASVTKRTTLTKKADLPEVPMSPAVPDAPNVFAYLDTAEPVIDGEIEHEGQDYAQTPSWMSGHLQKLPVESALPPHMLRDHASSSSSASSSHHGDDNLSETHHDVDTDRTTPEGSIGDHEETQQQEEESESDPEVQASNDDTSAKIASQMAAAQHRQNIHGHMHQFGTPTMQRISANIPHSPSTALSPRHSQHVKKHALPRAEKLPVSGYELLASQLSSRPVASDPEYGERIKPIYRKFEALNHRVLLHLQDELSELEEQLHRLDLSDTQSRRTPQDIIPASRRASAAAGGDLQWHKTDVLGKIGFKLAQYNQALSSFNSTRSLTAPHPEDVDAYRSYLQTANPIIEAETHFLDPEDDLVSIYSDHVPSTTTSYQSSNPSSSSSCSIPASAVESKISVTPSTTKTAPPHSATVIKALAASLAVSVLVPILTFFVIPGFIGRITATALVVGGVLFALMQGGCLDQGMLLRSEGLMCAGIYGGVMIVVAGIMPA